MVAEQRYRRRSEGRRGRRERSGSTVPPPLSPPRLRSQLGQAGAGSAMAARAGARVNVTRTKTGHRLTVLFYVGWEGGGKIMLDCGFSLPHQHTAAVTSGHPQQPVKEKHWTRCLIHRMFKSIVAIPLYPSYRDTCIDPGRSDPKEPLSH